MITHTHIVAVHVSRGGKGLFARDACKVTRALILD